MKPLGKFQTRHWIVFLLFLLSTEAQTAKPYQPVHPDPLLEPWRWQSFPGLKGQGLRCLVEARDGTLWFGTDGGVVRYGGKSWTTDTLVDEFFDSPINALCSARDGSVYAGSDRGISRFQNGKWKRVFPPEGDLPWPIDRILEASNGTLWAATAWGALHLRKTGPIIHTSREMGQALAVLAPYLEIARVPDKAIPTRPWEEGIGVQVVKGRYMSVRRGNAPMVVFMLAPGGVGEVAGLKVGDGILSVDGHLPTLPHRALNGRTGTSATLVVRRPGRTEPFEVTLTRGPAAGNFRNFSLSDVLEDRDGKLWFGLSWGGEILCFDTRRADAETAWRLYKPADGLDVGDGPRIAQTRDGAIWTASIDPGGGVNRFDGTAWTHVRMSEQGGNNVNTSILETGDGILWVGGLDGLLYAFREGAWTRYAPPEVPLPTVRLIELLEASDGAIWAVGLGQEAVRLDYGTSRWATYENLNFRAEAPDGSLWFVSRDNSVVRFDGVRWTRYDKDDGLMGVPQTLIATREGTIWAAGGHQNRAATARFEPAGTSMSRKPWTLQYHPQSFRMVDYNGILQLSSGALWFGTLGKRGVLQFDDGLWTYYTSAEVLVNPYAIEQTADGVLWVGGSGLRRFDGKVWTSITEPVALASRVHDMVVTTEDNLWIGTRTYGAFLFDGQHWQQYDVRDGLADSRVEAVLQTRDGSIWAATPKGISRFDGRTWSTLALPSDRISTDQRGGIHQSRDGALWINTRWRTVRYRADTRPPDTEITFAPDQIPQPGNTTLAWQGTDFWSDTPDEALLYAYRLDDGMWSAFSSERTRSFLSLPAGNHTFEVKARDRDFNEDPTPAIVPFTVLSPVWQRSWFVGLIAILLGAIGLQTGRVVRRGRRLRESNTALSKANKKLFEVNRELHHKTEDLTREISQREKLDTQIQHLQYLYRLRSTLSEAQSLDEVIRRTGKVLMEVLSVSTSGGVIIEHDGQTRTFGETRDTNLIHYERMLCWGGKERGHFRLFCSVELSQSQERALLDETAGQLTRVLEARELEMQLLQSARLVSLGQMAAGVAHELNQPLGGISATAEDYYLRLKDNMDVTPEQIQASFERILGMVDRLTDTVEHLRTFSRDTSQEPGIPIAINEVIHSSLGLIQTQLYNHGILIDLDLTADLPQVIGHPFQLEQVFLNLLSNARDALDERTKIEEAFEKQIHIRSFTNEEKKVFVEVEDSGVGISEANQERLFEPFFTTKDADQGMGLGLSISYAIVKNHRGEIICTSQKGSKTIFQVSLPRLNDSENTP